jgi:hypothetical protein
MSYRQHLKAVASHNFQTLRDAPLAELSGSLGDLGTLLPLYEHINGSETNTV